MAIQIQGQVGPQVLTDGVTALPRLGRLGDVMVSELHGRLYEQNARGNLYSGGMTLTSISAGTFSTGTLGATCTPIIGLWNPTGSGVNAVILQATLGVNQNSLTATGCGPLVWATSLGNAAITTGVAPLNRKTLLAAGSQCKDVTGVALTGLSTNLTVRLASSLGGGSAFNAGQTGTAAGFVTLYAGSFEMLDGSIFVPPGGVLALLTVNNAPVAHSAASGLIWEEVPI